jgi:hypothetical protein
MGNEIQREREREREVECWRRVQDYGWSLDEAMKRKIWMSSKLNFNSIQQASHETVSHTSSLSYQSHFPKKNPHTRCIYNICAIFILLLLGAIAIKQRSSFSCNYNAGGSGEHLFVTFALKIDFMPSRLPSKKSFALSSRDIIIHFSFFCESFSLLLSRLRKKNYVRVPKTVLHHVEI